MDSISADLPQETRPAYERYLNIPVATRAVLTNKVNDYLVTVLNASGENEFLDYPTAQRISLSLIKLLELCPEEHLPHVQAAVLYFVNSDDASPDLESILGFDDDADVVNAVCRFLGRPDLAVAL